MIQLKDILNEILNTYQVEGTLISNKEENISDILNQIRGIRKVTVLNNVTPDDIPQKENIEYTRINIKFLSRTGKPEEDLEEFKREILNSGGGDKLRVPGVIAFKFDTNTLRRL